MPEPNDNRAAPQAMSQTQGWLDGAPGGDLNLDDLFPNPELAQRPQTPASPQAPQAPAAPPSPYMRTATGTVYNSLEDAVRGTEEKDRIIAQLRAEKAAEIGTDPLRRQPAPEDPSAAIYKRLAKAAGEGNAEDYVSTLRELTLQTLAPYGPLIAEAGREKVLRAAASENPQLREFVGSAEYLAVLERRPLLKEAIQRAESDPGAVSQLQEFYGLAYGDAVSRRAPVVVSAPQTPNPRPTLHPSTPSPTGQTPQPYSGSYSLDQPLPGSKAERQAALRAILQSGRDRGLDNADWNKAGY